jgi:hypothetical protein
VTGTEDWSISDATNGTVAFGDAISGVDTQTTIGSFTNNDLLMNSTLFDNKP